MKTLLPLVLALFINFFALAQFTDEMTFIDIYGNTINPSSILSEDKYIYLDFFSTSCGLCNNVADEVADAYEYYGANNGNVFFLGIDYNSSASACLNFASEHNSNFPIIAGEEEGTNVFTLFQPPGYPSGRLIHPSGETEASFNYSQIANLTENLSNFISPVENCNLVDLLSMEINSQNGTLILNVFTDSPYLIPYPTFNLLNSNGELLAQEQLNYYGLSGQSTHNLQLLTDPSTWESNLTIEIYGCTDDLAMNYIQNANLDDGSCTYAACYYLGFELLTSDISFTEANFGDGYTLNIPMVNHNSNWLAYPMSETVILNPPDSMSCENCEFNVIGNPWNTEETLTSNVSLNFDSPIPENYEIQVQVYLTNLCNNGQESESCQFNQVISYNLNPATLGCTDPNAVNFEPLAGLDDSSCLYTSSNCEAILIDINEGWNLVGFSCAEDIDAELAFSPYINRLIITKDYLGNAYLPEWNFNGIGNLERGYGYQLKITEAIEDFNLCNP